jgi:hypothetical protein
VACLLRMSMTGRRPVELTVVSAQLSDHVGILALFHTFTIKATL